MVKQFWQLRAVLGAALVCCPLSAHLFTQPSAIAFPLDLVNCHVEFVDDVCLGYDAQFGQDRVALLQAIDHSLDYLATDAAAMAYEAYPLAGVIQERVQQSLVRFRQLVATSHSAQQLQASVAQEFDFYRSVGSDGAGHVDFTGYFEPTYSASAVPTAEYRYPLYSRPADLDAWPLPHPTRAELEGTDGLQAGQGPLAELELVWLRDRLEAFLVQVQGSARLQLTDGSVMSVGYAGRTEYPYTSIGRALIEDGIVAEADLSLPVLLDYFEQHPEELNRYLPRNDRFVFFQATGGAPPMGSLNVPVTAGRSIATDKTLMPPGALALISLNLPVPSTAGNWQTRPINRYVLDQDTGGAIRGPGRVDIFVGTGELAGQQAGLINTSGRLYYLLLRQ
ncbi:murein transglycosylase A [Leptothoe sp. PORK10 BA2]|uniref:murein transglycosylase A n=1 Tax=Leptothoe sp. PORK10 BA2 TaxID=3110254 RepID=UPI002B2046D4|nr:MltA domain-containing protein [Leptothoe sp. PORK10 BA2]MEA5465248.1 MltA domain-containing protein [Leptothoe sp. PORK10 BA2]